MVQTTTSIPAHCPHRTRQVDVACYARMFPDLPPFEADEEFLYELGRAGGICDCGDAYDFPGSLSETAAGWPIFGQFVAHDITADRSTLRTRPHTAELHNSRSPQLNLECLYGDGPTGHPFLYQRDDPAKFLLAADEGDVPRNREGIALVGDPRNDSHMLVSQLHLALLKAHNTFAGEARQAGTAENHVFEAAARELRWHYQWIVLHEFLPALVGPALADRVLRDGPRYFHCEQGAFIPLEFANAAYRYGHSQIRHRYQLNNHSAPVPLFPNLLGFRPVPRELAVDWALYFDRPGRAPAQRSKKIDGKLVRALAQLPAIITGDCAKEADHSLAMRDLERGQGVGLPSGEAVARYMGVTPLTAGEVGVDSTGWRGETPLWYYILREAGVCAGGGRLGPVGGRIVAEVLTGLVDADATSYRCNPDWRPRKTLGELLAGE